MVLFEKFRAVNFFGKSVWEDLEQHEKSVLCVLHLLNIYITIFYINNGRQK